MIRKCSYCKIVKPLTDFHKQKSRPLGHRYECKPCSVKLAQARYHKNPAKFRAKVKDDNLCLKWRLFVEYSTGIPHCACCGEHRFQFLSLDHINGDGAAHRRQLKKDGRALYRDLKKRNFPKGFQVLCYNCNHAKGKLLECPAHNTNERCKEVSYA